MPKSCSPLAQEQDCSCGRGGEGGLLGLSWQRDVAAKKAGEILGGIRRTKKWGFCPALPCSGQTSPGVLCSAQASRSGAREGQRGVRKVRGLKEKSHEKRLREPGLFGLQEAGWGRGRRAWSHGSGQQSVLCCSRGWD